MGFLSKKKLNTDWAVEESERAVHIRRQTRRRRTQQNGRTARSNKLTNPRKGVVEVNCDADCDNGMLASACDVIARSH